MKKIILSMMLSALIFAFADAAVVQHIRLKNGTVLNGYIQQQDKNENITFRSENAVICIKGKDATTTERVYKVSELEKAWVEWAEKNDAFTGVGDGRTLTLNEVIFKKMDNSEEVDSVAEDPSMASVTNDFVIRHSNIVKVKVLEKGTTLKYLELTPNTYTFNWSDVESIKADKRAKTALSGVDITYQLKNGQEVTGQYAGEAYSTLSLYTKSGMVETFDIDNVMKYFYKPINPNQNIFEQCELIDVVRTKNNSTFRGVIVERNFTDGNNYIIIRQQSGSSQMLKMSEVQQYSKEENSEYNPKFDIILKHGEVVVNRVATDSVGVRKEGSTLVLDSINSKVVAPRDGSSFKVVVEYNNPHRLTSDHLLLVKLDKKKGKKNTVLYSFSTDIYEMKKFAPVSNETSVNNTTRLEYNLSGTGVYALYDQNTKKAMPFIIK